MFLRKIGRAGAIIVLAAVCFNVMAQKSTFEKPDFAYPEAVRGAASKELYKAIDAKDWKKTLQALVQLTVAANSVSTDSLTNMTGRIDSVARLMPSPWQSVGLLIEARLLADAYGANSCTYNQRNLPEGEVPALISEWSKDTFGRRILQLVEEAYGAREELGRMPLAELEPLATTCGDGSPFTTALDFMVYQGVDLLSPFAGSDSVIPFGRVGKLSLSADVSAMRNTMVDDLITQYESTDDEMALARALIEKSRMMSFSERYDYLLSRYSSLGASSSSATLLTEAWGSLNQNDTVKLKSFYLLAKQAVKIPSLENILAQLEAKSAQVSYGTQVLPGENIKVDVVWNNMPRLWLHLYRLPGRFEERSVNASVVASWQPVISKEIEAQDSVLLRLKEASEFPGQPAGRYTVLASALPDRFHMSGREKVQVRPFTVSSLSAVESNDPMRGNGKIYITDGRNGAPVEGASVVMVPRKKGRQILRRVTGKDGSVEQPEGGYKMTASFAGDTLRFENWRGSGRNEPERVTHVRILTDLAIYHPGDTVQFMAVAWSQLKESARVEKDLGVEVVMLDANYNPADTIVLRTDGHGRAWGQIKLPADGLLGSYTLQSTVNKRHCGQTSVTVADYKAPGFFVEVTDAGESVEIGDTVTIRGRAVTYAGVPVAGGNVKFNIKAHMPWWLFAEVSDASYGASTATDSDGTFCLKLPTDGLRGTPFARCAYELEVAVTSPAGETQQAPRAYFSLGNAHKIMADIPAAKERMKEAEFKVQVTDILDRASEAEVSYHLVRDGHTVDSGSFVSPRLQVDLSRLPSGCYEWRFSTEGATDVTMPMVLYGKDENNPPCDTALWIPDRKIVCSPMQTEVSFMVGSSYPDSWVLVQTADDSGLTREHWLKIDAKNEMLTVTAPKPGTTAVVRFAACRNLNHEFQMVEIQSAEYAEKLKPEVLSFRDKAVPGDFEKWSFRFRLGENPASCLGAAATMTDRALDAIMPFGWTLAPVDNWTVPGSLSRVIYIGKQSAWFMFGRPGSISVPRLCEPQWNFYGESLYGRAIHMRGVVYNMNAVSSSRASGLMLKKEQKVMATADVAMADVEVEEVAVAEAVADDGVMSASVDEVRMRPAEMPLAFFKPDMEADGDGVLNFGFEVPDFNTTWKLQLVAWTDAMKTSVSTYEIVAAKPVIARLNVPRFVRTGDEIVWRGTLSNASDSAALIDGIIEIADGLSGKVFATQEFSGVELAAGGSRVVEMPYTVPYSLQLVTVKLIAKSGRFADGEQTLVGVLPSASPVIDSKPFYLGRNQLSFSMQIPDNLSEGKSTLEFCGNPLWYCVTALPDIQEPAGNSVISMANNLFANSLASHLVGKYPQIGEAIKIWTREKGADSPLVSNLEKNRDLKSVVLENTPWVNDAASETLRMERLISLLDAGRAEKIIAKTLADLQLRQSSNGGWSWCDGMEASEYITMRVLAAMGMMKAHGCLPAEAELMAKRAIRFCDREIEKDYAAHPEWISETTLLRYLYVRGYFDVAATGAFASLRGRTLNLLSKNWRSLDITEKSIAAIVLSRAGKGGIAAEVLESMRQYAVKSEVQGVWFDNPGASSRLHTTVMALQAFSQLAPEDILVDGMCQWLVLQRRTQDWGGGIDAALIVATLLQSGADWTDVAAACVSIGGKEIPMSEFERFTSSGFITLDNGAGGKELRVERSARVPAWGGVMTQSVRPISEVKAGDVPDLKLTKTIYAVDETANGTELSDRPLKVGDKVRVMLTLTASRRIDYVAMTDERSACLEPVNQLSGYEWRDRTGYYREVRNASTQLFISSLEKGVHVLWYDCYVGQEGEFSCGIATAQSLYAPLITAHSRGSELKISNR